MIGTCLKRNYTINGNLKANEKESIMHGEVVRLTDIKDTKYFLTRFVPKI